jgi:aryl-alcohol dehydrogenase-like predicted oxidoreductase
MVDLVNCSKLGLGTVQWGLAYGVGNCSGRPSLEELGRILSHARAEGISLLDTALMYGDAESRIGTLQTQGMRVVTKMPSLADCAGQELGEFLRGAFSESLRNLNVDRVYGYLAHRSADVIGSCGKEVRAFLEDLRASGKAEKVGVSIYEGYEIRDVLRDFRPDIVQLPLNVLDQRLLRDGTLAELKAVGVEVHVRSVFLQGLLLLDLERIPSYFEPMRPLLARWHAQAGAQRLTLPEASLSFVRELPEVDMVIVGAESLAQMHEITTAYRTPVAVDASGLACQDPQWVDPRRWRAT